MSTLIKQQGFLSVLAVLLLVIIGFLGIALSYMYVGSATATNNMQQAENALYIAESGLEKGTRYISTPILTGTAPPARIACASVTGTANLTAASFGTGGGAGTFTVTTVDSSPIYASTTLSSAITATSSTIAVSSTTGFAPIGRIMIDRELINYGGISGNSFVGVLRGSNETYATAHASTAAVSQYQCDLDVVAAIPNLTSPLVQREIQQSVGLQEGWAVGTVSGTDFELTRWNRPTEVTWTNSAFSNSNAETLNAVSMLSNAEGWAVGNMKGTAFTLLHWKGSNWGAVALTATCDTQNLTGVSAVSSQEAWAVGDRYDPTSCTGTTTYNYTVLHWNGTSWAALTSASSIPIPASASTNQTLNAVHVIGTNGNSTGNLGFAVGNSGTILQYNGSHWVAATSPTTNNLYGVYIVSASEAWAVGAAGTILKWNGSTWSTFTSPTTTQLNSVNMLDATLSGTAQSGWAVGNSGVAVSYNGSTWSSHNTGSADNMLGVAMYFNSNDTWAVGAAGTIYHWNGNAWASVTSNVTTSLNGISLVVPQHYPFGWQEVYA